MEEEDSFVVIDIWGRYKGWPRGQGAEVVAGLGHVNGK